ncbi:hypothetical protein Tco_0046149 [Tanacetum coccineum]
MSSPDYIYPIIVPSDFDVEDAFSSTNTHDYTPASPDYFPATPRNISPDPLDGLSNVSLSPMFDPQDFFLPEDILPPHKRSCFLSFSSTNPSGPPQVFEIGENYHGVLDTSYARHVKHIETILNHLDEILLERIEQIRHDDEIVLARIRTSTLEILIEDIQIRHRSDMKSLLDKIHKLKNHKGGPLDH